MQPIIMTIPSSLIEATNHSNMRVVRCAFLLASPVILIGCYSSTTFRLIHNLSTKEQRAVSGMSFVMLEVFSNLFFLMFIFPDSDISIGSEIIFRKLYQTDIFKICCLQKVFDIFLSSVEINNFILKVYSR